MLGKADATPSIAVKDLDRARKYYEEALGLETVDKMGDEVQAIRLPIILCDLLPIGRPAESLPRSLATR